MFGSTYISRSPVGSRRASGLSTTRQDSERSPVPNNERLRDISERSHTNSGTGDDPGADSHGKSKNGPVFPSFKSLKMKRDSAPLSITEEHKRKMKEEARARRVARDPRQKILNLLDDPYSSKLAYILTFMVFFVILVSCTAFVLETLPQFYQENDDVWFWIEAVCVAFFTVEFGLRTLSSTVTCRRFGQHWKDVLTWIDIIAILPFYFEVIFEVDSSLTIVRVIRLARVFRVFKLSRYSSGLKTVGVALAKSRDALLLLVFFITIALILFSSAIYYAERGTYNETTETWVRDDGTNSPYDSIPASFWWCITTLTTVGYGDNVPITTAGKIIASFTMIAGVLIIALPASIIGSNFMDQYRKSKEEDDYRKRQDFRLKKLNLKDENVTLREQVQFVQRDNDELLSLFTEIQGLIKESTEKQKDLKVQIEVLNRRMDQQEELEAAVLEGNSFVQNDAQRKPFYHRLLKRNQSKDSVRETKESTSSPESSDRIELHNIKNGE